MSRWIPGLGLTAPPLGQLHRIPETSRPSWVLSSGSSTSWVDVEFSAYCPRGVTALQLFGLERFAGDGAADLGVLYLRKNGSSEGQTDAAHALRVRSQNHASGLSVGVGAQIVVECDEDAVIEYSVLNAREDAWLTILGFYLPVP